jgi:hypothetical protein
MPTNRRTGNRRKRGAQLPQYLLVDILECGRDFFGDLGDTDEYSRPGSESMAVLREAWADPNIKQLVATRHATFIESEGPHSWAQKVFDRPRAGSMCGKPELTRRVDHSEVSTEGEP